MAILLGFCELSVISAIDCIERKNERVHLLIEKKSPARIEVRFIGDLLLHSAQTRLWAVAFVSE